MNALMNDFDIKNATETTPQRWEGFSEIDQAIHENRLLAYRLRKSWADPWSRRLTTGVLLVIAAGFAFLAGTSLGFF
ncbi:MAG: hypothetical protein KDE25_01245 [Novosphingobium sp.]|nr:hypothetical protein [Novosphingobium sp.]